MVRVTSVPIIPTSTGWLRHMHKYLQDAIGYRALRSGECFPVPESTTSPQLPTQEEALLSQSKSFINLYGAWMYPSSLAPKEKSITRFQRQKVQPVLSESRRTKWITFPTEGQTIAQLLPLPTRTSNKLSVNLDCRWVNDGQPLHRAEAWGHGF